jgi:hypothetical protein
VTRAGTLAQSRVVSPSAAVCSALVQFIQVACASHGSLDRRLAQKRHVIHAPQHLAVRSLGHDQVLLAQFPARARRQVSPWSSRSIKFGDQATRVPQRGGADIGFEGWKERAA